MSTTTITTTKTEPTTIPPTRSPAEHLLVAMRSMLELNPHDELVKLIEFLGACDALDPVGIDPEPEVSNERAARCAHNAMILGEHVARAFIAMGEDEAGVVAAELAAHVRGRLWESYELTVKQNDADYREAWRQEQALHAKFRAEGRGLVPQEPGMSAADKRRMFARHEERAMRLDIADLEAAFDMRPELTLRPSDELALKALEAEASEDLDRWDAAGRTLAELDPEAFRAALALVQTMATKAGAS